jgi:hypothetical protein
MPEKVPFIKGKKPEREYDLDDESHLSELGLTANTELKIADRYVHYKNCDHAVVELKSSSLHKAVEQIEATVERLMKVGKKVDFAIIVTKKVNRFERRKFQRNKDKILVNPETNKPYQVRIGGKALNILLYYTSEVSKMYRGLNRFLKGGQSNWGYMLI